MNPVCPDCRSALEFAADSCRCAQGHEYPVRDGVPVLLLPAEGWDAAATAREFDALYQGEAEPWNYTRSGAEILKYAHLVSTARELAGAGRNIIDVGCSLGGATLPLAEAGFDLLALDLSPNAVHRANTRFRAASVKGHASFAVASATRLPVAPASCDVALLADGLRSWQLSPPQIASCLDETARALRPGSAAILMDYMHPRHFDRFIATIEASPLRVESVRYLDDRLFYKLEGWARKLGLREAFAGFFASVRVARGLRALSRLVGRRGSKHICVIARVR